MLAADVLARLPEAVAVARPELDVTDAGAVGALVGSVRPSVVVNCAAWTAVDDAETREADASLVNGQGAANLARAARDTGAVLLQVSTDYVFSGDAHTPYAEDAPTGPRGAYGRGKLAGERAVLAAGGYVVRTAWLYGAGGGNFVRTMLRLEGTRETVDVVDDQYGQPTWTADLAARLIALGQAAVAGTAPPGAYHGTNAGATTWYGLAREVFALAGADPSRVRPTTTAAFPRPAPRPAYSVLGHDRWRAAGMAPMRDWRAALREAMPALTDPGDNPRTPAGGPAPANSRGERDY
ncbi:dTDP-4-dehydrorhamnose reductase [Streptomyces smaragdinus]